MMIFKTFDMNHYSTNNFLVVDVDLVESTEQGITYAA